MTRLIPIAIVVALIVAGMVLSFGAGADHGSQAQISTAEIDPLVYEALENAEEVKVLISLGDPDGPLAEWTGEVRLRNAAKRQANVLSVLKKSDFTLITQYERASALSGLITASGLEKLANHPDVRAIGMVGNGSYDFGET